MPNLVSAFRRGSSGSVAIQVAIVLTVLIGFAALGSDLGYLYYQQRQAQAAADVSAFGGAVALATQHPVNFRTEANAIATNAGYTDGAASTTVVVNNPAATGNYTSNANSVEVIITRAYTMSLISFFHSGPITVYGRAVAVAGSADGLYCIFALDPTAASALVVNNNGSIASPSCGAAVNSSSSSALVVNNNGSIHGPVQVHGQWSLANNAVMDGHPQTQNGPTVADPYASLQILAPPACTAQSGSVGNNGSATLTAGHFCSGLNFSNNSVVTLGAGAYYVDTSLVFSNNVTVNATAGVTLIVNGNYAISISNNSTLNLTAPSTGPYAGLAFISSRTATSTIQQTFSNNVSLNVLGAIYFPNQVINFQNNSATAATRCTEIIGRIINIENNAYLNNNCTGTGVSPIGGSPSNLAE